MKIGVDHPDIAKALLEASIAYGDDECKAILKLAQILELETSEIISVGIELLSLAEDNWLKYSIAGALNRVSPEHPEAITALKRLLNDCRHENTKRLIANTLKKIDPENSQIVDVFLGLLKNTQSWDIAYWSAQSLGEICNNKLEVVQILLDLLISSSERRILDGAAHGVKKVFDIDALKLIVISLKGYLNDETWGNNLPLYSYAFEIIWHCASRMPYSDFYTLWHGSLNDANDGKIK